MAARRLGAGWFAALMVGTACASDPDPISVDPIDPPTLAPNAGGLGAFCDASNPCASGLYCTRAICCNTPCTGACMACTSVEKQDGSPDGTCGPSKFGSMPK